MADRGEYQTEQEYKWIIPHGFEFEKLKEIRNIDVTLLDIERITMAATYYDTVDSYIARMHGALRIRRENERSICCMKILTSSDGAYKKREEYEVASATILDGLQLLPTKGAPADICTKLLHSNLLVLCNIEFVRNVYRIEINHSTRSCIAEFAMDAGILKGKAVAHFEEVELEFISGCSDVFHSLAQLLESQFSFVPEPRSKIARAMTL